MFLMGVNRKSIDSKVSLKATRHRESLKVNNVNANDEQFALAA